VGKCWSSLQPEGEAHTEVRSLSPDPCDKAFKVEPVLQPIATEINVAVSEEENKETIIKIHLNQTKEMGHRFIRHLKS
jgi:hypothetical protein